MRLSTLPDDAVTLLALCVTLLTEAGIDVPPNQYVAGGTLAWDMPSLTVYVGPVYLGTPNQPQASSAWPNAIRWCAPFYIQILRDSTAVMPGFRGTRSPAVDQLQAEGIVMTNDLAALATLAMQIRAGGLMVPRSDMVGIGSITPLGPEGNMVGARCELHFQLDGQ